jgi:breast cancer 2 susceptibility protein
LAHAVRKVLIYTNQLPRNTEPCEVLEAYDKVELNIAGNGTHLAPWYTKLGFQPYPAVATLHTLSPEGGIVPCLHLVVTKERLFSYFYICGALMT